MKSPFKTPDEIDRASMQHVSEAAGAINEALARGSRRFNVAVGLLDGVLEGLRESGWDIKEEKRGEVEGTFLVVGRKKSS